MLAHEGQTPDNPKRLAEDLERQVREALCEHVLRSPILPPRMAHALAHNLESLETPLLADSTTLGDPGLAGTGNSNGSAARPSAGSGLPIRITEQLMAQISAALLDHLVERYGFPPALAREIIRHGRERALVKALDSDLPAQESADLLDGLQAGGRLSATLLLRALCWGHQPIFEAALARLAGIPEANARVLINDAGAGGFRAIYRKSGLPEELYRAFRAAFDVVQDSRRQNCRPWDESDRDRIIQSLVLAYEMLCPEDLETVLAQLARPAGPPAAVSAAHAVQSPRPAMTRLQAVPA